MKTLRIKLVVLALGLAMFIAPNVHAQGWAIESTIMELEKGPAANMADAIKYIDKAAAHKKTMNSPKMYLYRGWTYLKIATEYPDLYKEYPNALIIAHESLNKCIELDNTKKLKYAKPAEGHLLNVAVQYYNEALAFYNAQDYAKAAEYFNTTKSLLKYDVNGDLKRNNLTEEAVINLIAYASYGAEDYETAKTNFQELIDRGAADESVYTTLAQQYLNDKDTTAALETVQQGRELFDTDKSLIQIELNIYLQQGRVEELISKLDYAIEQDEENPVYYFARATSYEELGRIEDAEKDYDKIIEIDPEYYDAYFNKGVMYRKKVADLVNEQNEKGLYDQKSIIEYRDKMNKYNKLAVENFAYVFENDQEMSDADRLELATEMRSIYASLQEMDKYEEMKTWIEENQ